MLDIKILEPDIEKCEEMELQAIKASLGTTVVVNVERVHNMDKIKKYDVPSTPALVINKKVKAHGRIPDKSEIEKWVQEELQLATA